MRKPERCEIMVKSSYCQGYIIELLAAYLGRWGWQITQQDQGGFKAVLP